MSESTTDPSLEMLFSALTAEYESTRETSRSRDQLLGSLMNFMMLVFSAAFVFLSATPAQPNSPPNYLILLLISIVFTALSMHYLWQFRVIQELAAYENDVLRPKLDAIFKAVGYAKDVTVDTYQLWQWQSYLAKQEAQGTSLTRFVRGLTRAGMPFLSIVGSIGFLLLFLYYRGIWGLSQVELVLLLVASLYSLALLIAVIRPVLAMIGLYVKAK
jgi:hypothetical protein